MKRAARLARGVGAFLWDFVVGDDWVGAAGTAVLLAVGAAIVHLAGAPAWWLLPPGVALTLATTVRRAARATRPAPVVQKS